MMRNKRSTINLCINKIAETKRKRAGSVISFLF